MCECCGNDKEFLTFEYEGISGTVEFDFTMSIEIYGTVSLHARFNTLFGYENGAWHYNTKTRKIHNFGRGYENWDKGLKKALEDFMINTLQEDYNL